VENRKKAETRNRVNMPFSWTRGGSKLPSMSNVVMRDAEILGGEPVFKGTRVPVKSLFDHLEAGDSIEVFPRRISEREA